MSPKIGILALQGSISEHSSMLSLLGAQVVEVRLPEQLECLDGLIIPGGESTTISKLMNEYGLLESIKELAQSGLPVMGTCAGLILLARLPENLTPPTLQVMDIEVKRNAFGRQVDSFESDLAIPVLGEDPFHCIFIRAPIISDIGQGVDVLCQLPTDNGFVAARQGNLVACAFHPELTDDTRFHSYFLDIVAESIRAKDTCQIKS